MRCGNEPAMGTYYEVLGEPGSGGPPVLFIHGGGGTGAAFRTTLEGAPGWADQLVDRGHVVWLTDWPGCGRSGKRHLIDIEYADVVEGYRRLLRDVIGEPVVVVCHSMGGATAWQLIEHEGDLVAGVVAVAAVSPGNILPPGEILSEEGPLVHIRYSVTGIELTVDTSRGYFYEDAYLFRQGIATSTRFPRDRIDQLRAGILGCPPRMILQRVGVLEGLPGVEDTSAFKDARIRLIAGTEDPAHTREIETKTVELLRGWGADAELVWLADRGIEGNGHFLFFEDNSREILDILAEQIDAVGRPGSVPSQS